jgi:uncharacterized membrane protein YdfJ with MMPL/SSD domain
VQTPARRTAFAHKLIGGALGVNAPKEEQTFVGDSGKAHQLVDKHLPTMWNAIRDKVLRYPKVSAIAAVAVLLALASPALGMRAVPSGTDDTSNAGLADLRDTLVGQTVGPADGVSQALRGRHDGRDQGLRGLPQGPPPLVVGFVLTLAFLLVILIDATIVWAVLLPATMKLPGKWNWYLPKGLHWLPEFRHDGAEPAPSQA